MERLIQKDQSMEREAEEKGMKGSRQQRRETVKDMKDGGPIGDTRGFLPEASEKTTNY